jgi:hypothetical protein
MEDMWTAIFFGLQDINSQGMERNLESNNLLRIEPIIWRSINQEPL